MIGMEIVDSPSQSNTVTSWSTTFRKTKFTDQSAQTLFVDMYFKVGAWLAGRSLSFTCRWGSILSHRQFLGFCEDVNILAMLCGFLRVLQFHLPCVEKKVENTLKSVPQSVINMG